MLAMDLREPFRFKQGRRRTTFTPNGRSVCGIESRKMLKNRVAWATNDPSYSAHFFVGFSPGTQCPETELLGSRRYYTMESLISVVRATRASQGRKADSSFLAQTGIFTHGTGQVVEEPGAQVIVFPDDSDDHDFIDHMRQLADAIASNLAQDMVILDLRKGGVSFETSGHTCA